MPGGAPGIETRLPLLYHFGVGSGRITLNRFVGASSTAAARLFGLYPRKGTIAPGSDADIVLFDPDKKTTIKAEDLHQNCDYSPYEGMELRGWPRTVIARGRILVENGVWTQQEGATGGRYAASSRSQARRPESV
jgi:dihydropyrimidinase